MRDFHQAKWPGEDGKLEPLVFERAKGESEGIKSADTLAAETGLPECMLREDLDIPGLSEPEVVRHFTRLSQMNHGVDSGIYPLGSCTMKYNPKVADDMASLDEVRFLHPNQPEETVQGALEIIYELGDMLAEISGMDRVTFQPSAGAHGEFLGMLLIRAYHGSREVEGRTEIIVPDSAHGTNPASAVMAGYEVVEVPSNDRGRVDIEALESVVSDSTAALMLTNPNTLGLFEDEIERIVEVVHDVGGLLYYDGANLNSILGKVRPGDMGFDIVHFNLHKTFATPHGGGGPGAGPVGVKKELEEFLPRPLVEYDEEKDFYSWNEDGEKSIGKVQSYHGNFGVLVKAYAYLLLMGAAGLEEVSETAVLNANYIRKRLGDVEGYETKFDSNSPCKHETVFSAELLKSRYGVTASDVSKRLLDYGVHAPTCYFPLIVPEALMIEPTETEPLDEINHFIDALEEISEDVRNDSERIRSAPHKTSIGRLDEVGASRNPILSWKMYIEGEG